jgi:hypothetical protein
MNIRKFSEMCHIKNQGNAVLRSIRENGMRDFNEVVGEVKLLKLASHKNACEFVLACLFEIEKCGYVLSATLDLAKAFAINTVATHSDKTH